MSQQFCSTSSIIATVLFIYRYKAAFYFALGNTLVAKDLEQATRIGLQGRTRHRVVTSLG